MGWSNQRGSKTSQACYSHPRCDLSLVHLLRFSLLLSLIGRIFFLHARGHKPIAPSCIFLLLFSLTSLIADEPHHYHPVCGHQGSSHLSPVHALRFFLSRCKFSSLTNRQPMVLRCTIPQGQVRRCYSLPSCQIVEDHLPRSPSTLSPSPPAHVFSLSRALPT